MEPKTIFHAHNYRFSNITDMLTELYQTGYDAVQISPAQQSIDGKEWYFRYQPFDHLSIAGLGTTDDIADLTKKAAELGIIIIADLVFNHMGALHGLTRNAWITAKDSENNGDNSFIESCYNRLSEFPGLDRNDFMPWRDMQGEDWDNHNRYEGWGCGDWAELRPTDNVLNRHKQHINILIELGIKGFRFDSVKHMRNEHIAVYVDHIKSKLPDAFIYGEVLSDKSDIINEYCNLFPITDFIVLKKIKMMLLYENCIQLQNNDYIHNGVHFAKNHDIAYNPPELFSAFVFDHYSLCETASCFLLLTSNRP